MSEITLEKTYALLEKLADYVTTEIPILKQDVAMFKRKVLTLEEKISLIIEGMDSQAASLNNLTHEMQSMSKTLDVNNDRIAKLEQHNFGYRVRDKEE